ncbi:hypothetical protein DAPPUDRAFT_323234 [Daphnia pulex]|uniref:MULE transposase domain-containing protein n=1 Tax=Daphnia pulex TaxID=6669 RepID=E9GYA0_DAPPU|nr:hypothetical protein DAPPUDRAFT_323234 [Daphnia pulex]|eukprot:EFX75562.1 hypothetical protein DAPPUDRAFT_323234 [Daphnia pulex]
MKKLNKYGEKTLTSCPAYVKRQRDGNFQMIHEHNHDGEELLEVKVRVYKKVKCKALRQKFDSAKDIVEEVLLNEYEKESGGFPVISDSVKQVPLFFAPMSSKRAKDYKAVLDTLLNLLPVEPNVEEFFSDFEQAIWLAVRQSFNGRVKMSGCYFHWSQAVWRKLVDIGLGPAYRKKCSETRKIYARKSRKFIENWSKYGDKKFHKPEISLKSRESKIIARCLNYDYECVCTKLAQYQQTNKIKTLFKDLHKRCEEIKPCWEHLNPDPEEPSPSVEITGEELATQKGSEVC